MMYFVNSDNKVVEVDATHAESAYYKYMPNGSVVSTHWCSAEQLVLPSDATCIVFDVVFDNPIDVYNYIVSMEYSVQTIIVTGIIKYYKNLPTNLKIQFFPFWALWSSDPHGTANILNNHHTFCCLPKKYKVSCLNGTAWPHRKLTYVYLKQKSYYDELVFSFHNRLTYHGHPTALVLTQKENEQFNLLPQFVTFKDDISFLDISINHPAYQETYVNLVTETVVDNSSFLSEKTFKPIVAGQLFVLIAGPGAIQFLRDIGIDTFDDIIDNSYDNIVDIRERITAALTQIDHLMTLDLEQLYIQIKPRLLHNSEYIRSDEFRQQFLLTFNTP